jgi:hypothetical protein
VFIFFHVPKTGGQTLRDFFIKHLVFHEEFIHLGPYGRGKEAALGLKPFARRPLGQRQRARVILGHHVTKDTHELVPGKTPRHVVFLREPAATVVSHYNFQMHLRRGRGQGVPSFDEWYRSARPNMMTRSIYHGFLRHLYPRRVTPRELRKANAVLETFHFVGCTEHMSRDVPILLRRMGITGRPDPANVSGVHFQSVLSLDPELRRDLNARNAIDLELYELWKDRLDESVRRIAAETRPAT